LSLWKAKQPPSSVDFLECGVIVVDYYATNGVIKLGEVFLALPLPLSLFCFRHPVLVVVINPDDLSVIVARSEGRRPRDNRLLCAGISFADVVGRREAKNAGANDDDLVHIEDRFGVAAYRAASGDRFHSF
jgi:hypothetical protein